MNGIFGRQVKLGYGEKGVLGLYPSRSTDKLVCHDWSKPWEIQIVVIKQAKRREEADTDNDIFGPGLIMDIMDQDVSEVRYKLRKGWSPDRIVSGKGITPLMAAVKSKNLEILETLVAARANLEQDDLLGQTPLHMAVMDAEVQLVKCLLDNGAKVNRQESWGGTALHLAVGGHKK